MKEAEWIYWKATEWYTEYLGLQKPGAWTFR